MKTDTTTVTPEMKLAYGLLWKSRSECPYSRSARKVLLSVMTKDDQKDGIEAAMKFVKAPGTVFPCGCETGE